VKFVLTIGFILSLSLLPFGSFAAILIGWSGLLAVAVVARVSPVHVARSGFVALPFLLAAAPLVFTRDGNILGHVDLGLFTLRISGEGLRDLGTIAFKSWVSVQAASLLVFTTRFHDLVHGLEQLKVPSLFISVMSLMYRYLAVLTGESSRMLRAREARSVRLPGRRRPSVFWRARQTGNMVGALFLRSLERSERVYMAMQARGYHGRMVRLGRRRLNGGELAALVLGATTLVAFSIAARFWIPIA